MPVRFLVLAGIMIFGVSASHAQIDGEKELGAPLSPQGGAIVAQLSQNWGDAATGQSDVPRDGAGAISALRTSDQARSSSNWLSADQAAGSGSCRYATPEQESFFCKIKRIFYERDSSGPNRDMDSNISAGGAGG